MNHQCSCDIKSSVALLSKQTIPQLELLACVMLARLVTAVRGMFHPVTKAKIVQCWTDSVTTLYWIKGCSKDWKISIENGVQEILNLTEQSILLIFPHGKHWHVNLPTILVGSQDRNAQLGL